MASERVDFVSSYCDRWCERCAFTDRCSAFACHAAIAMCGDAAEGIELAVGRPRSPEGSSDAEAGERFLEDLELPSDQEMVEIGRLEDARRARVDASAVAQTARTFMNRATAWIDAHRILDEHADPIVREAYQIARWDAYLVFVKLCRALSGRDRAVHDEDGDDRPVQSDWNGSAKVALISIVRSADAWRALGASPSDAAAAAIGDVVDQLT